VVFFAGQPNPVFYIVRVNSRPRQTGSNSLLNPASQPRNAQLWLAIILAAALALRVGYLIIYSGMPQWEMLTVDNYYHHHWAQDIADGDLLGDTTYFRAPFYVWFLSLLYALFGSSLWVARLFGLAIGLATVSLTYLLGKRVGGTKAGLIAAAVAAVYPVQLYFESELLLDPLFSLLLLSALERTLAWWRSGTAVTALAAGLLLGLAIITRPTALVVVPIIAVITLWPRPSRPPRLFRGLILLLLPVVALVGVTFVRNLVIADDPVLIASQGGINLYIGNNETADGLTAALPEPLGHNWQIAQITHIARTDLGRDLKPGQVSAYWQSRAVGWITNNPLEFAKLYWRKLTFCFADREISNNRALRPFFTAHPLISYNPLSFAWLLAASVVGLIFGWRSRSEYALLTATILVYTAAMALFFFNSRFRLPLLPCFYVFTAIGTIILVRSIAARSRRLWFILPTALLALAAAHLPGHSPKAATSAQPLISEALHYQSRGDHDHALRLLSRAAESDSTFPELHLNVGVSLLRLGHTDRARQQFERETALHPGRHKAWTNLASIALLQNRPDDALYFAERALTIAPYDITANRVWLRAVAGDTLSHPVSFTRAADRALARTDTSVYTALECGLLAMSRQEIEAARQYLKIATRAPHPPIETDDAAFGPDWINSPDTWRRQQAQAWYQLGYLAGREGLYQRSIALTREAIARDSSLAEAWINLVSGLIASGDLRKADSILTLAERRFPDNQLIRSLRQPH
jgi:4-amino-4-deoxy-L-arabinose transferase-like glycosyltransferase